ncbi:MAG: hypothetical protein NTY19_42015 [Planctomycetota bacterium]|nr:hypothetical protein [Planctomycetota bacterium]
MNHTHPLFILIVGFGGWSLSGMSAIAAAGEPDQAIVISAAIPSLRTDNHTINEAFRIAIGDLRGNVQPFKDGLLERPMPVIAKSGRFGTEAR